MVDYWLDVDIGIIFIYILISTEKKIYSNFFVFSNKDIKLMSSPIHMLRVLRELCSYPPFMLEWPVWSI